MNHKILGVIGSALVTLAILPTVSVIFLLIGYILLGIAINKTQAFNDFLIGAILNIIASFLFYFKIVAFVITTFLSVLSQNPLLPLTFSMIIYLIIFFVLNIISAIFFKKSFDKLAINYKNDFFKYAGYFIIIGAILVVFGIGLIISEIGWFLVLLGFFTITIDRKEVFDAEIVEENLIENRKKIEKN